jgi:hypothetical protein
VTGDVPGEAAAQAGGRRPAIVPGALTDPVLAAQPGRALVLGGWLLLGWYLARR